MAVAAVEIACRVMAAEKKDAPTVPEAEETVVLVEERDASINTTAIQNLMFIKHVVRVAAAGHILAPRAQEADIPGATVAMARDIAMCVVAAERCNVTIV